jgi:preprotein translocase subunit SecE
VKAVVNYFKEVRIELKKVIWPTRENVVRMTIIVFAISAIVAIYVGGLDVVFTKMLERLVSR